MKTIWLVNPYGPIEGEEWRTYSFNQFGKYLSKQGFKVIWWTANFAHHFKNYRSEGWKDIEVNENFIIRLVPTSSYNKNFSFGRFKKDIIFAKNAYKEFKVSERPDIIISADTPLTMSYPTFKFASEENIPVIYDQMDLWPEFIENVAGGVKGKFLRYLFTPIYLQRKKNYDQLSGVVALGKNYLEKAKEIQPSLGNKPQALIYNGIDVKQFRGNLSKKITKANIPKHKEDGEVWCVFAGTLGPSYDIKTIVECAEIFQNDSSFANKIKFIIAGSGPLEDYVTNAASRLNNIYYVGKLLPDELIPIYNLCDIGLSAYSKMSNVDMPDKFYDYTAAGLAVVNTLQGEIQSYIDEFNVGVRYEPGNSESLYHMISKISDQHMLKKIKENSNKLAMNFDKEVQNEKLLDVIKRVLDNKKR